MSNFFVAALLFFMQSVQAEEPALTITVEAHQDIEVYVAPITVLDMSDEFDVNIDYNATFGLASAHGKYSKAPGDIKFYNSKTISYVWDDGCSYKTEPLKCSAQHSHYMLETIVSISDDQFVVEMLLYDPGYQVVARGSWTDHSTIKWIKQQEVQSQTTVVPNGRQSARQCGENSCNSVSQPAAPTMIRDVSMPKEELPLKWVIPYRFLHKHLTQASLGLWIGAKL